MTNIHSPLQQLETLQRDSRFQELCRQVPRHTSNLFRVLRVDGNENVWSNILAWLLNPRETHGLGDDFMRRFLMIAARNSSASSAIAPLTGMDLSDMEVYREYVLPGGGGLDRADILLRSQASKILVLVENKVWSSEGLDQTQRYKDAADLLRRPDKSVMLIYLAPPFAAPPGSTAFIPCDYQEIATLLREFMHDHDGMDSRTRNLILDWTQTIERAFDMDPESQELQGLCRELWQNTSYRDALELLVRYRPSFWTDFEVNLKGCLPTNFATCVSGNNAVRFWPRGWKYSGKNYADLHYAVFSWGGRLWTGIEWKQAYFGDAARVQIKERIARVAARQSHLDTFCQTTPLGVDAHWLVHQDNQSADAVNSDDPQVWGEAIRTQVDAVQALLAEFPPELFENIPDVTGLR
jgi:hypothetical protein